MRNWIRLPIETKMNISKYFNIHIRKRNQRDPHIKSRKEIFQKPNGTKVSFFIFDINGTLDRYFFSNDFRVRVDHSNFDELYDFCVLNPFFKNHLLKHLDKFKTKRMAIKGMLVNSKIYMFLSDKLKSDPDILKLALRSRGGCALKDAPKNILSSNKYFQLLASEQIDVIRFFDKKILNNPKNFPLIVSKLYRIKNLTTVDCLPETLKQPFLITHIENNIRYFSLAEKLSPKWLLKNCGNNVSSYLKMFNKSRWNKVFKNRGENKYFKEIMNMKYAKEVRAAAILALVLNQIDTHRINSFFNVVINLINHPLIINKVYPAKGGYRAMSPFEIAKYGIKLKNLGFDTAFVEAVQRVIDEASDKLDVLNPAFDDIPF